MQLRQRIPFDKLVVGRKYYLSHTTIDKSIIIVKEKANKVAVIDWLNIYRGYSGVRNRWEIAMRQNIIKVSVREWQTSVRFINPYVWQRRYYNIIFSLLFKI